MCSLVGGGGSLLKGDHDLQTMTIMMQAAFYLSFFRVFEHVDFV